MVFVCWLVKVSESKSRCRRRCHHRHHQPIDDHHKQMNFTIRLGVIYYMFAALCSPVAGRVNVTND